MPSHDIQKRSRCSWLVRAAVLVLPALPVPPLLGQVSESVQQQPRVTIHPVVGAHVPVGESRKSVLGGPLAGVQLGLPLPRVGALQTAFVLTGFAARTRVAPVADGVDAIAQGVVTLYDYDAGVELAPSKSPSLHSSLAAWHPFVGIGGGGRRVSGRARGDAGRSGGAFYLTLGSEWRRVPLQRTAVRGEFRAYRSNALPPASSSDMSRPWRTDLVVALALAFHFR